MTTQEIKAKYQVSKEVKTSNAKFAKRIKLTFIIVPIILITVYVIINVINGTQIG